MQRDDSEILKQAFVLVFLGNYQYDPAPSANRKHSGFEGVVESTDNV